MIHNLGRFHTCRSLTRISFKLGAISCGLVCFQYFLKEKSKQTKCVDTKHVRMFNPLICQMCPFEPIASLENTYAYVEYCVKVLSNPSYLASTGMTFKLPSCYF